MRCRHLPGICHDRPVRTPMVLEAGLVSNRVRRPYDLLAAIGWLLVTGVVAVIGYLATATAAGLETDLTAAGAKLAPAVVFLLNLIAGLGIFLLPMAAAVEALLRRRFRALLDACLGVLLALIATSIASLAISHVGSPRLLLALAGSTDASRGTPTSPVLAALVSLLIVGRISSRVRWRTAGWVVVLATTTITILAGGITASGVLASAAFGAFIGHLSRWLLAVESTRARGADIHAALASHGLAVQELRGTTRTTRGRHYVATLTNGDVLDIRVLDRDLDGGDIWQALRRSIRVRGVGGTGLSVQRVLERAALMSYAVAAAGVSTHEVQVVTRLGEESALVATTRRPGRTLAALAAADTLRDEHIANAWRALATLHAAGIAHRDISEHTFAANDDGAVHVTGASLGTIAADDVQQRLDIASLLVVSAALTSAERSLAAARVAYSDGRVVQVLPALQRFALSPSARQLLRGNRQLLSALQQAVVALAPDQPVDDLRIERLRPRTIISLVAGSVAAYILVSQLANIDVVALLSDARPAWLIIAVIGSAITYAAAAMTYLGFVPEKLKTGRTLAAQLATSFANLMTPASVGSLALNVRYISRAGVPAPLAVASVGLSQVTGAAVYLLLLATSVFATGARHDIAFTLPRIAVVVAVALAVLVVGSLSIPQLRRRLLQRMRPLAQQVIPRLVSVAQSPAKLAAGVGGQFLLNLAYIATLSACINALGAELSLPATAVVFLAGSALGQSVPTPGGIGGVEAVMSAALAAAGLDVPVAVSATLLFRLVTFWLPVVPGWFAFRYLTNRRAI